MEATIMENQVEKKMENEMEYIGVIFSVQARQLRELDYWDNGKENGSYYSILGF